MKNSWLNKLEYPFSPNYFHVNGQKLHYIDEGRGKTILFVHGTPSWSFEYRNIIKQLASSYRCIAPDHIGFGLSDKPEQYDYTTRNHSKTLEQFILEKNLQDLTLVVHDFGGPIGLNVTIQHPERVSRLAILNTWLWSSAKDPDFKKMSRMLKNPLLPFLYRYLNFSARYILPNSFGEKKLSKELLTQYTRPFANKKQRYGPLAFAHSLLNDQEWFEELWNKKEFISGKPALFIWGMKDPVVKPSNLKKFQSGFPNSQTVQLEQCGHFPQEEEPHIVSESIHDFLEKN